jgi:Asp-tRNA(Asn)/Glu-tRNA(Gln) amidotransferase A subunit family amidase
MADLTILTIKEAHEGLKNGKFTSVDLTKAYLAKIKELNGELNAYLSVDEKIALDQAIRADERITLSVVEGYDFRYFAEFLVQ